MPKFTKENYFSLSKEYFLESIKDNSFLQKLFTDMDKILPVYNTIQYSCMYDDYIEISNFIGYSPNYKNNILIGFCRPAITHEIGHLVELDDISRIFKKDFGIPYAPEKFIRSSAKGFFCALAREQRVYSLEDIMNNAKSRSKFENPMWEFMAADRCPFGKFTKIEQVKDWLQSIIQQTFTNWDRDRIEFEWFRRLGMLKEKLI
ncbi:MAG: hypothetical protein LC122_14390 [Chitinophagales bacterium]|nr:hypothetical protein [Chitinophagales bacterium]